MRQLEISTPKESLGGPITASILIVDDRPANLITMEAVLEPLGHRVVRAGSGAEAVVRLESEEFAVVLLDVVMPGLDGFETAALLHQRQSVSAVPIIFVTADDRPEELRKGYARGAVDVLRKPFEPEVVRAKVSVFVDLYIQRETVRRQAELLRDRERLFGMLGRDLRAPLGAIAASALAGLDDAGLPTQTASRLRQIADGARQVTRNVENLIEFTRGGVERATLAPSPCDLHAICREAITDAQTTHPRRRIELQTDGSGAGTWDQGQLVQAVSNLVHDAVASSPVESAVRVAVRDLGAAVALDVSSEGASVVPDALASLLDPPPLRGAHDTLVLLADAPEQAGRNLGLYVVEQMVRAHHGDFRVTSDRDAGTTFRVKLPRDCSRLRA